MFHIQHLFSPSAGKTDLKARARSTPTSNTREERTKTSGLSSRGITVMVCRASSRTGTTVEAARRAATLDTGSLEVGEKKFFLSYFVPKSLHLTSTFSWYSLATNSLLTRHARTARSSPTPTRMLLGRTCALRSATSVTRMSTGIRHGASFRQRFLSAAPQVLRCVSLHPFILLAETHELFCSRNSTAKWPRCTATYSTS